MIYDRRIVHDREGSEEIREVFFSDLLIYRYKLDIEWDGRRPILAVIGLNPSTADQWRDDRTVAKCKKYAKSESFGTLRMLNAFAYRSTDPGDLFRVRDPVGPENTIEFLVQQSLSCTTVAAWGATILSRPWAYHYRGWEIADAIKNLYCFRVTAKSKDPEHPLYLPSGLKLKPFRYAND
jgi:hypothetical protein